jgi:hypothetical protein
MCHMPLYMIVLAVTQGSIKILGELGNRWETGGTGGSCTAAVLQVNPGWDGTFGTSGF